MIDGPEILPLDLNRLNSLLFLAKAHLNVTTLGLMRLSVFTDAYRVMGQEIIKVIDAATPLELLHEKVKPILAKYPKENADLFWSEIIKFCFKNAQFFENNLALDAMLKRLRRTVILQEELKSHIIDFFNSQSAEKQDNEFYRVVFNYKRCSNKVGDIFLRFIGQLIIDGEIEAAQAIHNFLHIAQKVAQNRSESECTYVDSAGKNTQEVSKTHGFDVIGTSVSPCLLLGLKLNGVLCQEEGYGMHFMRAASFVILQNSSFEKPFDLKDYENVHQPREFMMGQDGANKMQKGFALLAVAATPLVESLKKKVSSLELKFENLSLKEGEQTKVINPLFQREKQKEFAQRRTMSLVLSPRRKSEEEAAESPKTQTKDKTKKGVFGKKKL